MNLALREGHKKSNLVLDAVHSPGVAVGGWSGAGSHACAVGAGWVGSVGCLVVSRVGSVSVSVVVSARVVSWGVSHVSVAVVHHSVTIAVVAGGVVIGVVAGVV